MEKVLLIEETQIKEFLEKKIDAAIFKALERFKNVLTKDDLLTRKQAAEMLNVSLATLDDWTSSGILKSYKIGRSIRYKQYELLAALKPQN